MKAKRIICFALASIFALTAAACGTKPEDKPAGAGSSTGTPSSEAPVENSNFNKTGYPIVKEMVTYNVTSIVSDAAKPINESTLYKELEEKTNVKINYTTVLEKVWPEKKGILFSSNDLPDFFVGDNILTASDVVKYGTQGQIIDIKPLMNEYNPFMQAKLDAVPGLESSITTPDGKIYSYLGIDNSPMQVGYPAFINKDWLDKLGLQVPTTTEELYTVLKAFKEKDPNGNGKADEIPMTAYNNSYSDYFGAFGFLEEYVVNNKILNHVGVKDEGKTAYYTATTNEYKEAIKYFNRLFSEGLLDPESFSQDNSILNGKLKADERIVGVFQNWRNTSWQRTPEDADYVALPPVKGPNGAQQWPSRYKVNNGPFSFGSLSITANCKDPEIVARWADEFYEPDFSYQVSLQQLIGTHIEKQADGKFAPLELRDDFDLNSNLWFDKTRIHTMIVSDYMRGNPIAAHIQQKLDIEKPYLPFIKEKDLFPSMLYTAEETEQLSQLATDINGYADECYARWITNGGIDAEWDAYVKQINSMGADKFISIYQGALDRYNANL